MLADGSWLFAEPLYTLGAHPAQWLPLLSVCRRLYHATHREAYRSAMEKYAFAE